MVACVVATAFTSGCGKFDAGAGARKDGSSANTDGSAQETKDPTAEREMAQRNTCYVWWNYLLSGDNAGRAKDIARARLYATWAQRSLDPRLSAHAATVIAANQHPRNPPRDFSTSLERIGDACDKLGFDHSYRTYEADLDDPDLPRP